MEYQYFACEWWVSSSEVQHLWILASESEKLGIELRGVKDGYYDTNEGYRIMRFTVKVPFSMTLETLLGFIPKDSGFTNWYPISEADYLQYSLTSEGELCLTVYKHAQEYFYVFANMMAGLVEIGHRNENLRDKLQNQ